MPESPESLLAPFGGRLRLLCEHRGGEGRTFQVIDTAAGGAMRALRVLPAGLAATEASLLPSLRHPAIAVVHEIGTLPDGRAFVLREWLQGSPLQRLPQEPAELRWIVRELLEVIAYLHLRSVLHLDLKPANLVLSAGGDAGTRLAVLDFGLSVRRGGSARGGTPFFAAPELLLGACPDARADLFSIGAMVAQALSPGRGPSLEAFVRRFPRESFFTAAGIDPDHLPAPFGTFVRRCVSRRPDRRFPDAQAALEFLCGDGGRPSPSLLQPDPILCLADRLPSFADRPGSIALVDGEPRIRQGLSMHLAAELGDVERIDERGDETVLVRNSEGMSTWSVPALDATAVARHLELCCGLAGTAARKAADWLVGRAVTVGSDVASVMQDLLQLGELEPNGVRYTWPAAAHGRLPELTSGVGSGGGKAIAPDAGAVYSAVLAGQLEPALAAWRRLLASKDDRERQVREALARGLLDRGEPARALPLCSDMPVLRAQALLETGAIGAAAAALASYGGDDADGYAERRRRVVAQVDAAAGRYDDAVARLGRDDASWQEQVTLAAVLEQAGRLDECDRVLTGWRDRAGSSPGQFATATAATVAGHLARRRGRLAEAQVEFEGAYELFLALGHVRHCATMQLNLGVLAKDRGDHARAVQLLREARVLFERVGDEVRAAMARASLGIAAMERGDAETAVRELEPAARELRRQGDLASGGIALAVAARARLLLGARDVAVQLLAEAGAPLGDRMRTELERARTELAVIDRDRSAAASGDVDAAEPLRNPADMSDPKPSSPAGAPSRELFRAFVSVNHQLASAANLEQAMQHLLATAVSITGARNGYLLVADDDGMRCEVAFGDVPATGHSFSRSLAHRAMQCQRTMTGADALSDRGLQDAASIRDLGLRSAMCAPFRSARGVAGAVYVGHQGRADAFGAADADALEVLADQAAIAVDRLLQDERIAEELRESRRQLAVAGLRRRRKVRLLGGSDVMQQLRAEVQRLAPLDLSVLVSGETGTGKELVARALHEQGGRAKGAFVAENCAALPAELMERELFGHVRGAFTGADDDRLGLLELANGGTLLLDEVGDMPPALQAKLLRALQERSIRRVGSTVSVPLDLRVVAATHRDLRAMVAAGTFRQDLYYRLAGVELLVPPLRDRGDDVIELAEAFVARHAEQRGRELSLSPVVRAALRDYPWPGNVRELEHVIARAALLATGADIVAVDLPRVAPADHAAASGDRATPPTLKEVERRALLDAMQFSGGDKAKSARVLGISRTTLYGKLRLHGIDA